MSRIKVVKPPRVHNSLYHFTGLLFLILNKIRHTVQGYTNPRAFPITDFQRVIEYDFGVVETWLDHLNEYWGINSTLKEKTILELGPGPDLGIGLILLMKGAKKYYAMDVNSLIESTPDQFYEELFNYIDKIQDKETDTDYLRSQLKLAYCGQSDRLNYLCHRDFALSIFKGENIDLVFSQAAFEHFDDMENTIAQLSEVVKAGTMLTAEIDLKTHTRWIRDWDPLNIYRYSGLIYNIFKFPGAPNRLRPVEYRKILEKYGWGNITTTPLVVLEKGYLSRVVPSLIRRFRDPLNQMDHLSIMLLATRK